jgi:hypothetical protein
MELNSPYIPKDYNNAKFNFTFSEEYLESINSASTNSESHEETIEKPVEIS